MRTKGAAVAGCAVVALVIILGAVDVQLLKARVARLEAEDRRPTLIDSHPDDSPGDVSDAHLAYLARRWHSKGLAVSADPATFKRQVKARNEARYQGKSAAEADRIAAAVKP
jgi:hypothetical protein